MSLECPFCDLHDEQQRVIKTGELSTVFLSNPRLMPGHTLVIPNRHIEHPWELSNEELIAIFDDIKFVEHRLLKTLAAGCDIRQNYRPFLPQGNIKINHVHFHILPRINEDELFQKSMQFETPMFQKLSDDERDRMTQLLS